MKGKSNLIGFLLVPAGGVLSAIGLFFIGIPILIVGVFLFVSFPGSARFVDYATEENGKHVVTVRERHYMIPMIFFSLVKIPYKFLYYRAEITAEAEEPEMIPLERKDYQALVEQQRQQYVQLQVSKDTVAEFCGPKLFSYDRIRKTYIIYWVLFIMFLSTLTVALPIGLLFCVPMGIALFLQYSDMKDAKIKKAAWDHYFPPAQ